MLKSIKIRNFQSHEDTELRLHSGVNVIVGTSDSGKSAITRAIRWCAFNQGAGNIVSDFSDGKSTSVEIETDEHSIRRTKEKWNGYVVDGKELKAIGKGVPEEVQAAFNLDSINVQNQHDPTFLLAMRPGEIGKYLNQIVDLESIDDVSSHLHGKRLVVGQDLNRAHERQESLKADIEKLKYLDDVEALLSSAESKATKLQEWKDWLGDATALCTAHRKAAGRIAVLPRTDGAKGVLEAVDGQLEALHDANLRLDDLERVHGSYTRAMAKLERIGDTKAARLALIEAEDFKADLGFQKSHIDKLEKLRQAHERAVYSFSKNKKEIDIAQSAYDDLVRELGGVCPVCGNQLEGKDHVEP